MLDRLPVAAAAFLAIVAIAAPAVGRQQVPADPWAGVSSVVVPQARGYAVAADCPGCRGVEVESVAAAIEIRGQVARTTLEVALRNPTSRQEDAVLLLPVPAGAAVSGFTFQGASAEPTTRVLPADEARSLYDSIVARAKDPALLEFAGFNVVRSSVFPVPAQGTQRLRLSYENVLERDGSALAYVLPRSEALRHRRPWSIEVDVQSAEPVAAVLSVTHPFDVERLGTGHVRATLSREAILDPGPVRLTIALGAQAAASVQAYPDPEVGGGYFLLAGSFDEATAGDEPAVPREVTIVIDRSGSMAGDKLDQAVRAAASIIEGLDPGDAFNVIDYATTVSSLAPKPGAMGDDARRRALEYLAAIRPGGGTNIHDALLEALRQAPPDIATADARPAERSVLFMTDGLPTIGRTGELDIRRLVEMENTGTRRVFTFGVGTDVNAPLLDRVAEATRGDSIYVLPGEAIGPHVARVARHLDGPVLEGPRLEVLGSDGSPSTRLRELVPLPMPDLFEHQLVLLGQYRGDEPLTLRLSGTRHGVLRTSEFTLDPAAASTRHAFVPRLWATRRIGELVDAVRQRAAEVGTEGRDRELIDEIVRLSTKFGILTEYTAFLAEEGTDLARFDELAEGCRTQLNAKAVATRWGAGAVNQALNVKRQKAQTFLNYENRFVDEQLQAVSFDNVQQMCDRAFFRRGGRWIDSRLLDAAAAATPARVIMAGSAEHRALVDTLAAQGRAGLVALPGEILLEVDGEVVLVTDGC